ncbi:DUF1302 domain-containing protein [Castellaniella defragrans]|uniref:DUF1302 domain-containing protein n=1 Tax=Castellaniella defragrans TaxID=75697 RepID=A0A7W9TQZ0_CASDE|nr:DUF1302 domain-containing protein [Castellaniella defragrans]KAB0622715.1 DUF1302 domain-containing protein [Castellaniella defragrans]MBB6085270.1 hypothetical protein [Castellaniella defragrans]
MKNRVSILALCLAGAFGAAGPGGAQATDFQLGDWQGNWSSSISLETSVRARGQDSALYGQGNGAARGRADGTGNNTIDEGNLNYDKGDVISSRLKLISEVELKKGTMGAFLRGRAWYDYGQKNLDVHLGNQANGYRPNRPLSDDGFERLNRFSGVDLLDAYVYDTFTLAGQPLQVRAGNQVINWGESLFIQGINQINPIDLTSARMPGSQVKEILLPVPLVSVNQGLGNLGSVEMFYQLQWKNTAIDSACGNYWAVAGGSVGLYPNSCGNAVSVAGSSADGYRSGAYVGTLDGDKPSNTGQFGVAFRTYAEPIDSEIGVYAMKIHARTPAVSMHYGDYSASGSLIPFAVQWEYPEDIKIYGLSLATNVMGVSVGAELSHSRGVPVQIDANDLFLGAMGATGVIAPGMAIPFGPYGNGAMAARNSDGYLQGYTRANKTQFQLNGIKVGNGILAADQYLLIGEVGFQWNDLDTDALRYGRPFIFGPGPDASYGVPCSAINISKEGCKNKGYMTNFAWGYRLKAELTYNNVLNSGITVQPSIFWSHDVQGWSIDSQFAEGRQALGLGARFTYNKNYSLSLNAIRFNRNADYDAQRDRDFYSATLSMNF